MTGVFFEGRLTRLLLVVVAALMVCLTGSAVQAATLTTLVSLELSNGGYPYAGLTAGIVGNLYGTTSGGGTHGFGAVFKFDIATNAVTKLVNFDADNGLYPQAELLADAAGNLYSTTWRGGVYNCGSVFKLNLVTGDFTTIVSFDGSNGRSSNAPLIADAAGNLYGTSVWGGANDLGTVFKVDPINGVLTTLATFTGANGSDPWAGLTPDSAGNLYGATSLGGANNFGTLFKLDPTTGNLTTLMSFTGANGRNPIDSLIADAVGNLYGTTAEGGENDCGTIFKHDLATGVLTTLVTFTGANGRNPSGLIADAAGNLYGTTSLGGANNRGTVFKLNTTTSDLTTLASFNGSDGRLPTATLFADAVGNLYGTTVAGGVDDRGTIFKVSDTGFVVFVPEPGGATLAALAWVGVLSRRRG